MKLDVPKRHFTPPSVSAHQFQTPTGGRQTMGLNGARFFCDRPFTVPTYTVATAPDATLSAGQIIFVSDGLAGQHTLAISDGTAWKCASSDGSISAT